MQQVPSGHIRVIDEQAARSSLTYFTKNFGIMIAALAEITTP
jgi:hypothetical protein